MKQRQLWRDLDCAAGAKVTAGALDAALGGALFWLSAPLLCVGAATLIAVLPLGPLIGQRPASSIGS